MDTSLADVLHLRSRIAIAIAVAMVGMLVGGAYIALRGPAKRGATEVTAAAPSDCISQERQVLAELQQVAKQSLAPHGAPLTDARTCDDNGTLFPSVTAEVAGWSRRPQCLGWLKNRGWVSFGRSRVQDPQRRYVGQCVIDESRNQVLLVLFEKASLPPVSGP